MKNSRRFGNSKKTASFKWGHFRSIIIRQQADTCSSRAVRLISYFILRFVFVADITRALIGLF